MAAIVTSKRGTVLAFCEGRKNSGSDTGQIHLLLKRSADGGRTWSPSQVIWADGKNVCGNPAPVVDQMTGEIWLLLTWNRGEDSEREIKAGTGLDTRRVFLSRSQNEGVTWSRRWRLRLRSNLGTGGGMPLARAMGFS
jgi:sialidase-1